MSPITVAEFREAARASFLSASVAIMAASSGRPNVYLVESLELEVDIVGPPASTTEWRPEECRLAEPLSVWRRLLNRILRRRRALRRLRVVVNDNGVETQIQEERIGA